MSKLLNFLKAGPSAPPVVLLPDDRFFTRVIPTPAGATAAEVATQVELALETISPFPPSQLYYGYYWVPGSESALVFACYRKRFSSDQTSSWLGSQIVLPTFAAVLGGKHAPATAVVYPSPGLMTAVHWADGPVPNAVATRTVLPDASDEQRAKTRDELLRSVGESRKVIDLPGVPEARLSDDEKSFVFEAGEFSSEMSVAASAPLDVRDKGELDSLRGAQRRDVLLWRTFMGFAAALLVLGVAEVGVVAARKFWFQSMNVVINSQKPKVAAIQNANDLAESIQNLNTKLVLPFEMVSAIHPARPDINNTRVSFTRINVGTNIHELVVTATAQTPADWDAYLNAIKRQPSVLDVKPGTSVAGRGGVVTVPFTVVFKPDALKPTS